MYFLKEERLDHLMGVRAAVGLDDDLNNVAADYIFVSGGGDAGLNFYGLDDFKKLTLKRSLKICGNTVYAITQCAQNIYVADGDGSIRWTRRDLSQPWQERQKAHEGPVANLCYSEGLIYSGGWDAKCRIWQLVDNNLSLIYTLDHEFSYCVTVACTPTLLLVGSSDGKLQVFDKLSFEFLWKLDCHTEILRKIEVLRNDLAVTCSNDGSVHFVNLEKQGLAFSLPWESISLRYHMAWRWLGPDVLEGLVGSEDNVVTRFLLEVAEGLRFTVVQTQEYATNGSVWTVGFVGSSIFAGSDDRALRVWSDKPEEHYLADRQQHLSAARQNQKEMARAQLDPSKMTKVEDRHTVKGKKPGDVRMFANGQEIQAWSWEGSAWTLVGTVEGGSKSEKNQKYEGDSQFVPGLYEYIFDVDISDNRPPVRLPANSDDNLLAISEKFVIRENLPKTYVNQIVDFLRANMKVPVAPAPASESISSHVFPASLKTFGVPKTLDPCLGKLIEFNSDTPEALKEDEIKLLRSFVHKVVHKLEMISSLEREVAMEALRKWETPYLFPVIDLWRNYLCLADSVFYFKTSSQGAGLLAWVLSLFNAEDPKISAVVLRFFVNLGHQRTNLMAFWSFRARFLGFPWDLWFRNPANKGLRTAYLMCLVNLAIVAHEKKQRDENIFVRLFECLSILKVEFNGEEAEPVDLVLLGIGTCCLEVETLTDSHRTMLDSLPGNLVPEILRVAA